MVFTTGSTIPPIRVRQSTTCCLFHSRCTDTDICGIQTRRNCSERAVCTQFWRPWMRTGVTRRCAVCHVSLRSYTATPRRTPLVSKRHCGGTRYTIRGQYRRATFRHWYSSHSVRLRRLGATQADPFFPLSTAVLTLQVVLSRKGCSKPPASQLASNRTYSRTLRRFLRSFFMHRWF